MTHHTYIAHNPGPMFAQNPGRAGLLIATLLLFSACRVESVAPGGEATVSRSSTEAPSGELWVYTSMYRQVIDALEPLMKQRLPNVTIHWYQAGSEKVASRLEAEAAAGAVRADLIATSDPFLYERLKREGSLLPYASPHALRIPRELLDLDAHYAAARISTMVLVHRRGLAQPPKTFAELAEPRWRGKVAIGDPLTSGTAFTWSVFIEGRYGAGFFERLRSNEVVVAGGNAAVLQKVEGGEAEVGVLLLENALAAEARGSPVQHTYPEDGAVLIPGPLAIFKSTRNPAAAKAFVDVVLSPEGQRIIVERGDMHAVDPRLPGPRQESGLEGLMPRSQHWSADLLERGVSKGDQVKATFTKAFAP